MHITNEQETRLLVNVMEDKEKQLQHRKVQRRTNYSSDFIISSVSLSFYFVHIKAMMTDNGGLILKSLYRHM